MKFISSLAIVALFNLGLSQALSYDNTQILLQLDEENVVLVNLSSDDGDEDAIEQKRGGLDKHLKVKGANRKAKQKAFMDAVKGGDPSAI